MRKSHLKILAVAGAAVCYVAAAPALAQDVQEAIPETVPSPQLTPDQQAEVLTWPADQQASYQLWPAETQGYYWSLAPERQALFWRLSDEDKIAITAMTGPERDAAWNQIENSFSEPPSER